MVVAIGQTLSSFGLRMSSTVQLTASYDAQLDFYYGSRSGVTIVTVSATHPTLIGPKW
jgi:hypothetical protein